MSFQYGGGYEPSAPPMQNYPSEVNSMLLQENFALKQEIDRLKAELATRVQTTTQIPVPQSPEKGVINAISGWQKLTFSRQYTQNPIVMLQCETSDMSTAFVANVTKQDCDVCMFKAWEEHPWTTGKIHYVIYPQD